MCFHLSHPLFFSFSLLCKHVLVIFPSNILSAYLFIVVVFLSYFYFLSSSSFFQGPMILSPSGWMCMLLWAPTRRLMSNTWPPSLAFWPRKSWWSGPWHRYWSEVSDVNITRHVGSQIVNRSLYESYIFCTYSESLCVLQSSRSVGFCSCNVHCHVICFQNLTFKEQLDAGIRYFDLRVSSKPDEPGNEIYFIHGLFGHKVSKGKDIYWYLNAYRCSCCPCRPCRHVLSYCFTAVCHCIIPKCWIILSPAVRWSKLHLNVKILVLYFVSAWTVFSSSIVVFCFQLVLLEVDMRDGLEQGSKVVSVAVNIPPLKWVTVSQ